MDYKRKVLFLVVIGIIICGIIMAIFINVNKEEKPHEEPVINQGPVITEQDENGVENSVKLKEGEESIETIVTECIEKEENINYMSYDENLADIYYSEKYKAIRENEKSDKKRDIEKYEVKKFIHSLLVMSVNFFDSRSKAVATVFFADVVEKPVSKTYLRKNGFNEDGQAERIKQYIFINEEGNWKIDEERSI